MVHAHSCFNGFFVVQISQEVFTSVKTNRRKAKKAHNGAVRSTKKKRTKSRAAYSLRGVAGEVVTPP